MGCCISKIKPKSQLIHQPTSPIQDKLVIISQPSKKPNKISPSPPSPINSTFSSSTATSTNTTVSAYSSGSKDRSFSNEFLLSCLKENPHIIRIDSLRERSPFHITKLDSPARQVAASQKRVRSSSPAPSNLTRQKSFRRESDRYYTNNYSNNYSHSSRSLRSPSPSRRYNGDNNIGFSSLALKNSGSRRMVSPKVTPMHYSVSSHIGSHDLKMATSISMKHPINSSRSCLRNRETRIHRISSKIDQIAVEEALARKDNDPVPMEDIDNPLISLDCFIFV